MKKLLMCSAAIALGLAVAAPAKADGIKLDLAGHFKGYVTWSVRIRTIEPLAKASIRHFDILRETEIHFTGETTLDNGLTVGVHHQALIDSPTTAAWGNWRRPFRHPEILCLLLRRLGPRQLRQGRRCELPAGSRRSVGRRELRRPASVRQPVQYSGDEH